MAKLENKSQKTSTRERVFLGGVMPLLLILISYIWNQVRERTYGFNLRKCLSHIKLYLYYKRTGKEESSKVKSSAPFLEIDAYRKFIRRNSDYWKQSDQVKCVEIDKNSYVLIELTVDHSGYTLTNLIIGRYLMQAYGKSGAALLKNRFTGLEEICRSYGIEKFFYLADAHGTLFTGIKKSFYVFVKLFNVRTLEEFFEIRNHGVNLCKNTYDNYLRCSGEGTIEKFNYTLFVDIVRSLHYQDYLTILYDSIDCNHLVQAELQFIPNTTIFQLALAKGILVHARGGGPNRLSIKQYREIENAYCNLYRPSLQTFEWVIQNQLDKAVKEGEECIFRRFRANPVEGDIPDIVNSFKKDEVLVSREELCERMGWDSQKPIAGIMSNALTDGVFTNRWTIYPDLLTWLRETIKIAMEIESVNWFIKPHPSDLRNNVITTVQGEYEKLVKDCPHVQLLPEDVGSRSLPSFVDYILTAHGNAGIEYSCFGIPAILAGESLYSEFGFTHEPKTPLEYEQLLKNIFKLPRLSEEQIKRAKAFSYLALRLTKVHFELIPEFSSFAYYDEEKLWQDATAMFEKVDPENDRTYRMLEIQQKNKDCNVLNYDWVGQGL